MARGLAGHAIDRAHGSDHESHVLTQRGSAKPAKALPDAGGELLAIEAPEIPFAVDLADEIGHREAAFINGKPLHPARQRDVSDRRIQHVKPLGPPTLS